MPFQPFNVGIVTLYYVQYVPHVSVQ